MTARNVLVTDADHFVGRAAVERFRSEGDEVIGRVEPFTSRAEVAAFVAEHGPFDVVVDNLDAHSVGREMARHGVRVDGIAPNFIENPSYFPPETVADPEFRETLHTTVPAQRLGRGDEAAAVLWWLASADASYVFGAVIPTDGGWTL